MRIVPVILSGGSGSRLWPLSTEEKPKQFLRLEGNLTMIQETLLRLRGLGCTPPVVSCGEGHRFLVAQQIADVLPLMGMDSGQKPTILLEPLARGTAPAIAAACAAALSMDDDAVVVVLPSDHAISDTAAFQSAVRTALFHAQKGFLVTFGVVPTFPATGYGYIKAASAREDGARAIERFVEKPPLPTAREYLADGSYLWNSGMFVFRARTFLDELSRLEPDMERSAVRSYQDAASDSDFVRLDRESFSECRQGSVDRSVMERTQLGRVVDLSAGWDDLGSWASLYDRGAKDGSMNVTSGTVVQVGTSSSYIRGGRRPVAVVGLSDVVIVDSDDALLVASRGSVQDVGKIPGLLSGMERS